MRKRLPTVDIYMDTLNEWRFRAPIRRIIADSGEGYTRRADAIKAFNRATAYVNREIAWKIDDPPWDPMKPIRGPRR